MIVYKILPNGYFGGTVEVLNPEEGLEPGLTTTGFEFDVPESMWAYWIGTGWALTSADPDAPVVVISPEPDPQPEQLEPQAQLELPLDEFVDPAQGI